MPKYRNYLQVFTTGVVAIVAILLMILIGTEILPVNSAVQIPPIVSASANMQGDAYAISQGVAQNSRDMSLIDRSSYDIGSIPLPYQASLYPSIVFNFNTSFSIRGSFSNGRAPYYLQAVICNGVWYNMNYNLGSTFDYTIPCTFRLGSNNLTIIGSDSSYISLCKPVCTTAYGAYGTNSAYGAIGAYGSNNIIDSRNALGCRKNIGPCSVVPTPKYFNISIINATFLTSGCLDMHTPNPGISDAGYVIYNYTIYNDFCADEYNFTRFYCLTYQSKYYLENYTFDCGYYGDRCLNGACASSLTNCIDDNSSNSTLSVMSISKDGSVSRIKNIEIDGNHKFLVSFGSRDGNVVLDTVNAKVLYSSNPSYMSIHAVNSYASSETAANQVLSSDKASYIIELADKPLISIYSSYLKNLALIKLAPIGQSGSSSSVKALSSMQESGISALNIAYNAEMIQQAATIDADQKSIALEMIEHKIISSDTDIKARYKNVLNGMDVVISLGDLDRIKELPGVVAVYPDTMVHASEDYSIPLINADKVWNMTDSKGRHITGSNVTIAIIDTGVDYTQPDLGGCYGNNTLNTPCKVIGGYNFAYANTNIMDDNGHGTHVAATAAGKGVLDGVAPDAKILAYKVLDSTGNGYMSTVIEGIERAVDPNQDGNFSDHANIISLSIGGSSGTSDSPDAIAVDNAVSAGVVAVVAAGNSGPLYDTIECPGCADNAITVGATDSMDALAYFSSRGPTQSYTLKPDVSAPGVNICAAESSQDKIWAIYNSKGIDIHCVDNHHINISGTSMATPHVSGVAALLLQRYPSLTPDEIKAIIVQTSKPLDNYSLIEAGAGRVDALAAIESDSFVTPSELNPMVIRNSDTNMILTIHNNANYARGYTIYYGSISYFNGATESNLSISTTPYTVCVQPLSTSAITLKLPASVSSSLGFYSGKITVTEAQDCGPAHVFVQNLTVPFSYKLYRVVNITIIPRNFGSGYTHDPAIFILTDSNLSWLAPMQSIDLSNLTPVSFSLNVLSDSTLYAIYTSSANKYYVDRTESNKAIALGEYIMQGISNIVLNENTAVPINTDFAQAASAYGLDKYAEELTLELAGNSQNSPSTMTFSLRDIKCDYLLKDHEDYISNNGVFRKIFISESAKQPGKMWYDSSSMLSLQHVFNYGDSLNYNYPLQNILKGSISWDHAFRTGNFSISPGFLNFFSDSEIISINQLDVESFNESALPKYISLYYMPGANFWTQTDIFLTADKSSYMYQRFFEGTLGSNSYPLLNDLTFFKMPLTLVFLNRYGSVKAFYDNAIFGMFSTSLNYTIPTDASAGFIFGPATTFTNTAVTLPNNARYSGVGAPIIDCSNPQSSTPALPYCLPGKYYIEWNVSSFIVGGTPAGANLTACYDTNRLWHLNTGSC